MNTNAKKLVKMGMLAIFLIFIAGYAFFVSKDLIFGIRIKNVNLEDGAVVSQSVQEVTGNARNAVKLTLNGREIHINQQGDFKETLTLLPGYNIINITARDKFGGVDEKNYKIIYSN